MDQTNNAEFTPEELAEARRWIGAADALPRDYSGTEIRAYAQERLEARKDLEALKERE